MNDICSNRHGGNSESMEANAKLATRERDQRRFYDWYVQRGPEGAIREEAL